MEDTGASSLVPQGPCARLVATSMTSEAHGLHQHQHQHQHHHHNHLIQQPLQQQQQDQILPENSSADLMSVRHSDDDMLSSESPCSADLQIQSLSCDWGPMNVNSSCHSSQLVDNSACQQQQQQQQLHHDTTSCVSYSNLQEALDASLEALASISCRSTSPPSSTDPIDLHNEFMPVEQQQQLTAVPANQYLSNTPLVSYDQSHYADTPAAIQSSESSPGSISPPDLIHSGLDMFKQEFSQNQFEPVPVDSNEFISKQEFDEFAQSQFSDPSTTATSAPTFQAETFTTMKTMTRMRKK